MANTRDFEEKVIRVVQGLNKTVMGWEEVLFKTGAAAAFPGVVVDSWARSSWQQAAVAGHRAVDSNDGDFYLDSPGHTAAGMWTDISGGTTNATLLALLLGGEASMWQDWYVPPREASCMFQSPQRDNDFANSTSSTIWPRAAVAAGSFWRYDPGLAASSSLFASVLAAVGRRLALRGVTTCPCTTATATHCSQTEYCGRQWCEPGGTRTPVLV